MAKDQGHYALLQFSPVPERMEFVNVGVVLFVPDRSYVGVRFSQNLRRVERLYGKQPKGYIDMLKSAFESRIHVEFDQGFDPKKLQSFALSRANNMRMSRILPVAFDGSPDQELQMLFDILVGEELIRSRAPKLVHELKLKFEKAGVAQYVQRPPPVRLPQGVTIEAPYGYEDDAFNLIAPVRMGSDPDQALAQASKQAIEGRWLRRHSAEEGSPKRLIVVGDFSDQAPEFVSAVVDMMEEHGVRLYDWENVDPLISEIRRNAQSHEVQPFLQ